MSALARLARKRSIAPETLRISRAPELGRAARVSLVMLAASAVAASASSLSSGISGLFGGGSSRAERQGEIDKQRVRLSALERAEILNQDGQLATLQYRTFILNTRLEPMPIV